MNPIIKELIEQAAEYEELASAEDIDELEREIMAGNYGTEEERKRSW